MVLIFSPKATNDYGDELRASVISTERYPAKVKGLRARLIILPGEKYKPRPWWTRQLFRGGHSNQDPSCTQKPIYSTLFYEADLVLITVLLRHIIPGTLCTSVKYEREYFPTVVWHCSRRNWTTISQ